MQTPNYLPATRYGGPIRSCHGLASALVRLGFTVDVVTSNVDGPNIIDAPIGEPVEVDGVKVRYCPVNTPKRVYASSTMRVAFENLVPKADLLHINGMFLWPSVQAARAAKQAHVPYIVTPRGMLAPELIRAKSSFIKRSWIALFERRLLKNAHKIHVTAKLEAEGIRQQGLNLSPFAKIPNGVSLPDTNTLAGAGRTIWRNVPRGKRIAFLARLDWKKGVDIAISAAIQIPDAFLFIAGPDQIGLQSRFENEIEAAGISNRIRFIGPLEDQEKWGFLAEADVHIVPSLNENFGNTVIEALAVGTPVLCAPEVGAGEWASQLDPSCFVQRDGKSFATALEALFSDHARMGRIRREAPRWVAERFSWAAIAKQFISMAQLSDAKIPGSMQQRA
ncbi:MAG: glycosyltransferase [Pseudomonadota bacterium]